MSGSPPVTHTPSSSPWRFFRKASTSSTGMFSTSLLPATRSALWQNGQRKSQPGVNTVAAVCPGKSSNVSFCKPAMRMGYSVPFVSAVAGAPATAVWPAPVLAPTLAPASVRTLAGSGRALPVSSSISSAHTAVFGPSTCIACPISCLCAGRYFIHSSTSACLNSAGSSTSRMDPNAMAEW